MTKSLQHGDYLELCAWKHRDLSGLRFTAVSDRIAVLVNVAAPPCPEAPPSKSVMVLDTVTMDKLDKIFGRTSSCST